MYRYTCGLQADSFQHELVTLKETLENEKAKYARFEQQIKGIVTPQGRDKDANLTTAMTYANALPHAGTPISYAG